jgi:hypothetical protein
MSRRFDRTLQINTEVVRILEDPATMHYLAGKLIRKKPKLMPRLVWKVLMLIVLAPNTRKKPYSPLPTSGTP